MKVIIDWVANHSAFDNVWAENHKEWYNLDSLGGLQPPMGTDWWDVADLNFDNPEMRAGMIDAMAFWLREANIDGFRCDVASEVPTDFWDAAADSLRAINKEIFMLAEAEYPELHQQAFNAGYGWEWLHIINGVAKGEKTLADIDTYMSKADTAFPEGAYKMYFTTNHDENSWNGTVFDRFGEGHLAFAAVTFTIDGMPLVYSGQEAGLNYALKFFEKDTVKWGDYAYMGFYTRLFQLKLANQALWNGDHGGDFKRLKTTDDEHVYAFVRTKGDNQVVTIANLSDTYTKLTFESLPEGDFKSLFDQERLDLIAKNGLELAPWGYHVLYK
jgi:glycosidase